MSQLLYDASLHSDPPPAALDFRDTRFFHRNADGSSAELPSPATVRAMCPGAHSGNVNFEHLGLFVKFGFDYHVSIEEAQTLQALPRAFPDNEISIPELFGWRREEDINFIYMSLIPGTTLKASWPTLTEQEKTYILQQLERMVSLLRTLRQHSDHPLIGIDFFELTLLVMAEHVRSGSVSRTRVQDLFFQSDLHAGPFSCVKEFNDRLQFWAANWLPVSQRPPDPFRPLLPDTSSICFSHADLHLGNIIVSGRPGSRSIAAIVDWGMSGWYPEYWEYCKMILGTGNRGYGSEEWLPRVLKVYDMEYEAFVNYWQWRGVP